MKDPVRFYFVYENSGEVLDKHKAIGTFTGPVCLHMIFSLFIP